MRLRAKPQASWSAAALGIFPGERADAVEARASVGARANVGASGTAARAALDPADGHALALTGALRCVNRTAAEHRRQHGRRDP